ncbi:glycosyltransferase [Muricoccus radiodurans]|uniref:glycosyltransferase n=1 Tax=Muricoccus radiodurans TaxID=2231721 RepID=UPI003CE91FDA
MAAPAARTGRAAPVLERPVILFAFNRPDYLLRVCTSLLRQNGVTVDPRRVFLVQDGAVSPRTGVRYAEDAAVAASIAAFREVFPQGQVAAARANLGVSRNIRRGEALAFEALDAEYAYFLEDDLELGPDYLRIMEEMARLAEADPRIGYFAAYGDHKAEAPGPECYLVPLQHHWAFGLRREPWRRLRDWLAPYDAILEPTDYTYRDHLAVFRWMESLPVAINFSSQDAVKSLGCAALGIARVMTDVCFGRYIGAQGASFRDERFQSMGYDRMAWKEGPDFRLAEGLETQVGAILAHRRDGYGRYREKKLAPFLANYRKTHFDDDAPLTREDVDAHYRVFLRRTPEAGDYADLVGRQTPKALRRALLAAREFRGANPVPPVG